MLRQAFQKNPHILRVCSGFFEKLSLPKTKISHFRTGSKREGEKWEKSESEFPDGLFPIGEGHFIPKISVKIKNYTMQVEK
jgi:hypothetical protein